MNRVYNRDGSTFELPARWIPLDLSREPEPPDDLVPRVLTRGWITLFSGPPGVGKTYAYHALIAAAITGDDWLGLPVCGIERVLVIDEENGAAIVQPRLRAFGLGPQDAERVLYFSQLGCRLGSSAEPGWGEELLAISRAVRPDLVVIDSASSATATALNENDSISATFSTVLRPLAQLDCAVILVAHDRKRGGDVGDRVLGGVQWTGQIDRHIAFEASGLRADSWTTPEGTLRVSFPFRMIAGKSRQGVGIEDTRASIESEQDADGRYRWVRLRVGEVRGDTKQELGGRILAFLATRDGGRAQLGEIAAEFGMNRNDGRLSRTLDAMIRRDAISKPERGVYVAAVA